MKKLAYLISVMLFALVSLLAFKADRLNVPPLQISANHRYFTTAGGQPFFWLGDTGWLLFLKLNREDAEKYLENRRQKGFNVIQVMVLHSVSAVNVYGDSALVNKNVATPRVTPGNSPGDKQQYDYWDHIEYILDLAAKKGLYIAMVPVWGSNIKSKYVNQIQGRAYAQFLARRFKNKRNIIWMNGGDITGGDSIKVWRAIGETLHEDDPRHLITFHPRGRTTSSLWFHNDNWLSFNTFQSGHRTYAQDTSKTDFNYGEDNWKYVNRDYKKLPAKPTLDAEPSYEGIPHGLHDTLQPRWTDADVRRYAYWSVFAGACGYTYGNNSVMQMLQPTDKGSAYGAKKMWFDAVDDVGASQMKYIKQLMLSRPYFARVPDQGLVAGKNRTRYSYLAATRGKNYAFIYTFTGGAVPINMGKIAGDKVKASWFNPRNGITTSVGTFTNRGVKTFQSPGKPAYGNDWVLILDKA
jgi:hypothetical protein